MKQATPSHLPQTANNDLITVANASTPSVLRGDRLFSSLTHNSIKVRRSRPDMKAFLEQVSVIHQSEVEIPVLVGGPVAMTEEALEITARINQKFMLKEKGPHLFFRKIVAW